MFCSIWHQLRAQSFPFHPTALASWSLEGSASGGTLDVKRQQKGKATLTLAASVAVAVAELVAAVL